MAVRTKTAGQTALEENFFLPDFCGGPATLSLVLVAELLALLITAAHHTAGSDPWLYLARISLFLQWIALSSAAVLCLSRRRLARMSVRTASLVAYGLLLATTLVLSEAAYRAAAWSGVGAELLPVDHAGFLVRNLVLAAIATALLLRYFYVQHQWKHNVQREAQARIEALQARIRPHFLFNSMNTIAALIRTKPDVAERTLEDLADLFRASLSASGHQVPLSEELAVAMQYQRIEQLRLGDRLHVEWRVQTLPPDARVPRLILQPLLENAIYHGIEPLASGGVVEIEGHMDKSSICLDVLNPVPGEGAPRRPPGNRMALDNVHQRLLLAYPGEAALEVSNTAGTYKVSLRFPYRTKDQ